jgi:hypothetical protein
VNLDTRLLVLLLNGNLILPKRVTQFKHYLANFNNWVQSGNIILPTIAFINSNILPTVYDAWISGFTLEGISL